ncbi:hypothetical protein EDB83DRAFT_549115 [Lactarius deliciosus]|nr:hypothetical protein EDB83DRAFT_549115 [Lactarius deliciosus]
MSSFKQVIPIYTVSIVGVHSGMDCRSIRADGRAERRSVFQDMPESKDEYDLPAPGAWKPIAPGRHAPASLEMTRNNQRDLVKRTSGLASLRRHVTIEVLSDDVLLKAFGFYRLSSPLHWQRLAHVCRKWRSIVFVSSRRLDLRLYCTPGRPVLKTLDCWPAFPIAVKYGGSPTLDPPAPEDEDNIVAALARCDRVNSVSLTVTSSLLEKLGTIQEPFSGLQKLVLLSRNIPWSEIPPRTFRQAPHLRTLHLTRIVLPSLPQLLSSSRDLVDIQLQELPNTPYFSSKSFRDDLSGMAQLRSLSLHFLFSANRFAVSRPSGKRVVLPALTRLSFRGDTEYLECFVATVHAPRLRDIKITFLNQHPFNVSELSRFLNRIEMQRSYRRADILSSKRAVSICFTQPGAPMRLKFEVSREPLNWHLFMSHIYNHFSALLVGVEDLRVHATWTSIVQNYTDREQWLEVISRFRGAKWFLVAGDRSTDFLRALQLSKRRPETVLPALLKLCIREPGSRYARWREAVASLIVSHQLSGRLIGVEYERTWTNEQGGTGIKKKVCTLLAPHANLLGAGPLFRQVTIEVLSDDVLLNIFRHYLDASSRLWPALTHVCKKWRRIVLTSPQGLNLRLYCTHGRPVLRALDCWPPLPIVLQYGGSPTLDSPAPEDEDNITAALSHCDRVSSISLTVTSSLLEKMRTIEEPFLELEELVLLSEDTRGLALPSGFRWGPRLHSLDLTRIASPALPQLLSPSLDLVDLQLQEIPNDGYFSPNEFANALSGMTQLRSLSLHFLSSPGRSHRNDFGVASLLRERVVLPALTSLNYRGISTYLDSLVARIDAPCLENLEITFFHQLTLDVSRLSQFVYQIEAQKSHDQADVLISQHAISITFTRRGNPARIRLQVSCEQFDWKLSSLARICGNFPYFTFGVGDLRIETTQLSSLSGHDVDGEQWMELIRLFNGTERFHLVTELATDILHALQTEGELAPGVLYSLKHVYMQVPEPHGESLPTAAKSFATSRRRSGRPVKVEYTHSTLRPTTEPTFEPTLEAALEPALQLAIQLALEPTKPTWKPTLEPTKPTGKPALAREQTRQRTDQVPSFPMRWAREAGQHVGRLS